MSFLNPVNEPVLRFSSTDANAPQINYNSRVAGDVKAVLKACLVTGYGDKASAGWTAENEVNNVIEFVSPSTAMSDYRLGIDDTSTSSTTWYYQYQNLRVNPARNAQTKNIVQIDKTNAENGWQLLVTPRGLFFVEIFYSAHVSNTIARISYWGALKSALPDVTSKNIAYWCIGASSDMGLPYIFFDASRTAYRHFNLQGHTNLIPSSANVDMLSVPEINASSGSVDIDATLYYREATDFVAEQPGMIVRRLGSTTDMYGVYDGLYGTRDALYVNVGTTYNSESLISKYGRNIILYLDYWEY